MLAFRVSEYSSPGFAISQANTLRELYLSFLFMKYSFFYSEATAVKTSIYCQSFQGIWKILAFLLFLHTWPFLCWILNLSVLLCRTVSKKLCKTTTLLSQCNKMKEPKLTLIIQLVFSTRQWRDWVQVISSWFSETCNAMNTIFCRICILKWLSPAISPTA